MDNTHKLFILTGASGVGKSTSLFKLSERCNCEVAPKYSERFQRKGTDDIIHVDNIHDTECDIIYELYGTKYGVNTNELKEKMRYKNQILVISEFESIKKLKCIFKERLFVTYIIQSNDHFKDFIEYYIEREGLSMPSSTRDALINLSNKGFSTIVYSEDLDKYNFDEKIYKEMMECFPNKSEFENFFKRLESSCKIKELYKRNKELFDRSCCANEVGSILNKYCDISDTTCDKVF